MALRLFLASKRTYGIVGFEWKFLLIELASFMLEVIRPDLKHHLEPVNHAKQPAGTAVCGCFVLFWIEQRCRQHKGESPTSLGWPRSKTWSERVKKLMKAIADLQANLTADAAKKAEKDCKKMKNTIFRFLLI